MKIKCLKNNEIDKAKWDEAIDNAKNGSLYAYSWYLDSLAENWDALVVGNYEYIMPLPWKKKYGIAYIYPVFFIQKLGVFSSLELNESIYIQFLNTIPTKFRHIHMSLNRGSQFKYPNTKMKIRTNYILDISRPYFDIYNGYSQNIKRNLKQAKDNGFVYAEHFNIKEVLAMFQKYPGEALSNIKSKDYNRLENAAEKASLQKKIVIRKLTNSEGEVLSSAMFFLAHNTAYYLINSQTPEGKKKHAIHFLLDSFIQEYSGILKFLDFEGSDNYGIAEFFRKWGSEKENYLVIKTRKFPFNILKNTI